MLLILFHMYMYNCIWLLFICQVEQDTENSFGWSFDYLRFSTPTVLGRPIHCLRKLCYVPLCQYVSLDNGLTLFRFTDGCLVMTNNCAFIVSPRLSPERLAFELCQIPFTSSLSSSPPLSSPSHSNVSRHGTPAELFATAIGTVDMADYAHSWCDRTTHD